VKGAEVVAEQMRAAQRGRSEALPIHELEQWFAETVEIRHHPARDMDGFMTSEDRRALRESYQADPARQRLTRTPVGDFEVVDNTIISGIVYDGPEPGDYRAVRFVYTVEGDKIVKLEDSDLPSPG
jgi:hypothetical protein